MASDTIDVLNDLIKVSRDGEKGFLTASQDVNNGSLRSLLDASAMRCAESALALQDLVRGLGGEPATEGSAAGALHRGWVDVRAKATGNPERAVLEECERGEDSAKKSYEKALQDHILPAHVRQVIERQYQGVLANHNKVRRLREDFKASDID